MATAAQKNQTQRNAIIFVAVVVAAFLIYKYLPAIIESLKPKQQGYQGGGVTGGGGADYFPQQGYGGNPVAPTNPFGGAGLGGGPNSNTSSGSLPTQLPLAPIALGAAVGQGNADLKANINADTIISGIEDGPLVSPDFGNISNLNPYTLQDAGLPVGPDGQIALANFDAPGFAQVGSGVGSVLAGAAATQIGPLDMATQPTEISSLIDLLSPYPLPDQTSASSDLNFSYDPSSYDTADDYAQEDESYDSGSDSGDTGNNGGGGDSGGGGGDQGSDPGSGDGGDSDGGDPE